MPHQCPTNDEGKALLSSLRHWRGIGGAFVIFPFPAARLVGTLRAHVPFLSLSRSLTMLNRVLVGVVAILAACSPCAAEDAKPEVKAKLEGHRGGVTAL